jgi:hypothetical protein
MSQGQLWLFSKNKISGSYVRNVVLTIEGTFSIEDNLNDTPSNTKIKSTTSATYREEFEVNTIAYHPDTTTWWVIKSDVSTYIQTGEYEHEIELVELLEFYSYRHLPNCAFAPKHIHATTNVKSCFLYWKTKRYYFSKSVSSVFRPKQTNAFYVF